MGILPDYPHRNQLAFRIHSEIQPCLHIAMPENHLTCAQWGLHAGGVVERVDVVIYGLAVFGVVTIVDHVEAVTREDVNRVAAELLDPEKLSFMVVGQPEGLPAPTQ